MYSLNPYDGHSNYKIDLDIKDKTSFFHFSFIITYPNVETLELAINRKTKKIFDPLDSRKNWTLWEELDVVEIFWQYSIETNRENEPYQEWQVSTSSMGFNLEIIKPRICYLTPMKKFSSYSVARENQLQMRIDIEIPKIMDLQKKFYWGAYGILGDKFVRDYFTHQQKPMGKPDFHQPKYFQCFTKI